MGAFRGSDTDRLKDAKSDTLNPNFAVLQFLVVGFVSKFSASSIPSLLATLCQGAVCQFVGPFRIEPSI